MPIRIWWTRWPVLTAGLVCLVAIGLSLPACAGPTPASPPMPLPDSYIVADDFSHPNSAWARFDTEEGAVYALAGELYLEDRGQGTAVYSPLIGHSYEDVTVDVDVRHVQGTVDNWMGVLCRQQDEENYYFLGISADGYYLILRVVDGESTPVAGPEYHEVIRLGKAENHLRASCRGTTFSLWVNEELVARGTDRTLQEAGETALFADAVQRGEILVVAFDDFILASP
ncbi:MAG: hypothetical protein ACP5HG_06745 [Anaerolineae bacterium]